jgi:hypothetical protein
VPLFITSKQCPTPEPITDRPRYSVRFRSPHSKAAQTDGSTGRGAAFIAATEEVQFAFSPKWRVNQELNADGDQPVSNGKTPTPTTGTDGSSRSNADRNAMESRSGK